MAEMFQLKIITPDRVFYDGRASFVEFTTKEGEVGVYADHEPMTMLLDPGVLNIHEESGMRKAALHTGFVEIMPEGISILAQIAEWPEEIDENRAKEAQIRAQRRIKEDGGNIRDELALRRAMARIKAIQ